MANADPFENDNKGRSNRILGAIGNEDSAGGESGDRRQRSGLAAAGDAAVHAFGEEAARAASAVVNDVEHL